MNATASSSPFRGGEEVVLIGGSHQEPVCALRAKPYGTPGVFLSVRQDPKWADITERNGAVKSHPLQWLGHASLPTTVRGPNSASQVQLT